MRDHNQCRAHLDHLYGPRGAGAPLKNTNAFKTGAYARPGSKKYLQTLAYAVNSAPDQLPQLLARPIQSLHNRQADPLKTLMLLTRHCRQLTGYLADQIFIMELNSYLNSLPVRESSAFQTVAWQYALTMSSIDKVFFLRTLISAYEKRK